MGNSELCLRQRKSNKGVRTQQLSKGKVGKAFFAYSLLQVAFIVGTCWREGRKETKKKNTGEREREREKGKKNPAHEWKDVAWSLPASGRLALIYDAVRFPGRGRPVHAGGEATRR